MVLIVGTMQISENMKCYLILYKEADTYGLNSCSSQIISGFEVNIMKQ